MPDLLEQLRDYGEAVEQEALRAGEREHFQDRLSWRPRPLVLLAAAALIAVLAVGGVALRLVLADAKVKVVATVPTTPGAPITTAPPRSPTTTAAEGETTSTTQEEGTSSSSSSTTTTAGVRPAPGVPSQVTTTTSQATGTTTSTSPGASTTTTTPTVRATAVRGTATWLGGRDPRARLEVGACPVGNTELGCGSAWKVTDVAPDGSFELQLPTGDSPRDWNVVALVSHGEFSCAFGCQWRTSQAGRPTTISDATTPAALDLTVAARVVDVFVRDRNGNVIFTNNAPYGQPFVGGGVMVRDIRCLQNPCPSDHAAMFSQSSATDGGARIVVDPTLTYDLSGMAMNTGWPNPQFTGSDGSTSWHSLTIRRTGSEIVDGFVFVVNGAPA